MSAYRTVVVGTDGSDSSLRAVDRAGTIAAQSGAKVYVASAYFPQHDDPRAADVLKDESYKTTGAAPIYAILKEAHERATAAGAKDVEERPVVGAPVDALVELAEEVEGRPAGGRQRRAEHDHRPSAGIGAGQCFAESQDRRPDRPHHQLTAARRRSSPSETA